MPKYKVVGVLNHNGKLQSKDDVVELPEHVAMDPAVRGAVVRIPDEEAPSDKK